MKEPLKTAILLLVLSTSLYACGGNASKAAIDTANADSIKKAVMQDPNGVITSTTTTTSSTTTVDPVTNDSTIITKTVIKHSAKK